ncbi:hypothetical protein [Pelagibaculum spongiae]|uniref:Uncharacterized protein n=1 Tax=Pelagibaculum spongiae TaxID=2080658 RepID=A0A2V1GYJ3_9GAMM|nr:hypothetical protein [Pelagibaculum spongiae]PVZ68116.1 hypothetical protein DC094_12475 [Pelagibaculum spongiae]
MIECVLCLDVDGTLLVSSDESIPHKTTAADFYARQGYPEKKLNFSGSPIPKLKGIKTAVRDRTPEHINSSFTPVNHSAYTEIFKRIFSGDLKGRVQIVVITKGPYSMSNLGVTLDVLFQTSQKMRGGAHRGLFQHDAYFLTRVPFDDMAHSMFANPGWDSITDVQSKLAVIKGVQAASITKDIIIDYWLDQGLIFPGRRPYYILLDDTDKHVKNIKFPNVGLDPTSLNFYSDLCRALQRAEPVASVSDPRSLFAGNKKKPLLPPGTPPLVPPRRH